MRSIAARVHGTFFAFSITVAIAMIVLMIMVDGDLESTMLENDLDDEIHFLLTQHPQDKRIEWQSASVKIFYIPASNQQDLVLPKVFEGIPTPFSGEVEVGEQTFLVRTTQRPNARIYVARDITAFEKRSASFQLILAIASAAMLLFTYFFAKLGSERLTRPLSDLAQRMQAITAGKQMPRLPHAYQDAELLMIAVTFNAFLGELETFVRREQSLMNLASHELRTPIAVVSGAVDILLRRDHLDASDRKTVERIRLACDEMSANVEMLLKLARRSDTQNQNEAVDVPVLVREVLDDLSSRFAIGERVDIAGLTPVTLHTDRVLLKMLLRNLIQNALQHTTTVVQVVADEHCLQVSDHGAGLPPRLRVATSGELQVNADGAQGGLGLYIVTLICERLGWRLAVGAREGGGTVIGVLVAPV